MPFMLSRIFDSSSSGPRGGGTVEITSIDLRWGAVQITANGTLALNNELQPVGAFATQIAGLESFVTALENSGVLSPSDAAIVRITLSVLTRSSDDGGPDRADRSLGPERHRPIHSG